MVVLLFSLLSPDVQILLFSLWLDVRSLVNFDLALSSHECRPHWITILSSIRSAAIDDWSHSLSSLMWLTRRGIHTRKMQIKVDAWQVRGCDLLQLEMNDLVHLGLHDCRCVTNQFIVDIVPRCRNLNTIDLSNCRSLTDVGISALGAGCSQLQSIDLTFCDQVTDAGISALGAGCGQLQSINLEHCDQVTDAGISALRAGCSQLRLRIYS